MARITAKQLQIFNAHLEAYKTGNWDYPNGFKGTAEDLMNEIKNGKTSKGVWEQVVSRYVSVTSQLLASPQLFQHTTGAFVTQARKGFKILLDLYNIQ